MEQTACKQFVENNNFHHLYKTASRLAAQYCNNSYQRAFHQRSRMLAILYGHSNEFAISILLHLVQICYCSRKNAVTYGFQQGIRSATYADLGLPISYLDAFLPALSNTQYRSEIPEYWNQRNHILSLEKRLSKNLSLELQQIVSVYLEAEDDLLTIESHCAYFSGWQAGKISALSRNPFSPITSSSHNLFLARYYLQVPKK